MIFQVTGSMASVVKGMDKAMESMNLEKARIEIHLVTHVNRVTNE